MLVDNLVSEQKTITKKFSPYNTYGEEEQKAALEVLQSGVLSKFIGAWCQDFYGGPKVQSFERSWEQYFNVKHAVSVNSATSGLIAALGAIGLEPGDEVIVSPWTMSATATAILVWNAIPIFADIEESTFNLDPLNVISKITNRTKAIVVTDIFGHAAKLNELKDIAKAHGLILIEDAAQAPGALYKGQFVGTVADIGVFSLNYHKHIHTGEGGVCVTNNSEFAEKMNLIRNHAEAVVHAKGVTDLPNMIGFNFRLGEIEAALGIEQLKKLPSILAERAKLTQHLISLLKNLPGLRLPIIEADCTHVFYVFPFIIDRQLISLPRADIVGALRDEGLEGIAEGYANIHLLPIYQQKMAYGKQHYPWSMPGVNSVNYEKGICPIAERLHQSDYFSFLISMFNLTEDDIELVAKVFYKAWERLGIL
jgi:perosamine synthetase